MRPAGLVGSVHVLARIGRMLQQPGFVDLLREADDSEAAYQVICDAEARVG